MEDKRLYDGEYRFMCVIWDNEPLSSGELVRLCEESLGWKKSTTYTVLRKLCEKGYLRNESTIVSSVVGRDEAQRRESETFVDRTFGGSLPGFLAAFLQGKRISDAEAEDLKRLIDEYTERD